MHFYQKFRYPETTKFQKVVIEITPEEYSKEIDLDGDSRIDKNLSVTFEITPIRASQYKVDGFFEGELIIPCSRCLKPILITNFVKFTHVYKYTDDNSLIDSDEDSDITYFNKTYLDFFELFRDEILLNVPDYLFCKDDCRGLCEICGTNLNEDSCNHYKNNV
ncbi:DUF177 domain-containing protein [bacterium]|nr:DUF177 domain-containing protein [bacterium]